MNVEGREMEPATMIDTDDDDRPQMCMKCEGEGELLVCMDDICQGRGYCFHGDGMVMCPYCQGSGENE